jgi:pyruvate dehydrogenase complex dehydrogenase (E1) component
MTNEKRLALEMRVVRKLVKDGLAAGYSVSVCDGEEWTVKRSTKLGQIVAALRTTDEDYLAFHTAAGIYVGKVFLVYGNEPYEVVNDYSANDAMEELMKGANAVADKVEEFC